MRLALTLLALGASIGSRLHAATPLPEFARGADISWQQEMENAKVVFKDASGKAGDLLDILKGHGFNSVRLRVWVNPQWHWSDSADVTRLAKRAKAKGFRIMIDFHYSDSWADPGQQTKPGAWASHNFEQLKADVSAHTTSVLKMLRDSGITPEWVQVGNETNDGMLWEDGKASKSMTNFAALVQSGSKAAKAVFPQTKVIVHISNGWDNGLFRWMFDGLRTNKVEWDVIGMSLYPETATWRTTMAQCKTNMQDMVSRYGKQVVISEVGMDWRAADSCYALLKKMIPDVQNLSNGAGLG
ncbi:MAG: glycosyl hydrolase 53 family protein, partial [Fibrobacterota bacterium]